MVLGVVFGVGRIVSRLFSMKEGRTWTKRVGAHRKLSESGLDWDKMSENAM